MITLTIHYSSGRSDVTQFETIADAFVAYNEMIKWGDVVKAALTSPELNKPLAYFDRTQPLNSDGKKIVYDIR